jgi:antitoxin component YwqK of YwqJK toxin-antitoxin module
MRKVTFLAALVLFSIGTLVEAQEAIQDGLTKIYYPNGKVSSEGLMRNGKPDGFWRTYYPSGIIKSAGKRTNYLLDSVWVFFNESADTIQKVNYVMGKRNGYTYGYSIRKNNNDPMSRGRIVSKELYVNDKKEGPSYLYHPNGQTKEESFYTNNKRNGFTREYDEKGTIIMVSNYKNGFLLEREKQNRKDENGLKQGLWRTYFDNGRPRTEAFFLDDLLTGTYKEFEENGNIKVLLQYANGNIIEEKDTVAMDIEIRNEYDNEGNLIKSGSYRESVPVGIHRTYDKNGKVIDAILYDNNGIKTGQGIITNEGKKEGDWKYFYRERRISATGKYSNNLQTGNWKYFYLDGKTEQTGNYKQGKTDGLWQWFYSDGSLKREEEYYEGLPEGIYIEYDTLGQTLVNGKYFDGQKEEEWIYKVGDYTEKGRYVADLKDGVWKAYYSNGKLKYEGSYIQGNPDGEHFFYYPNGQLKETNYYLMGISEKNWKKYDENGMLVLTITYKDNREYRINGEKVAFDEADIKLIQ